jgi:putative RecB family exonuclease
MLQELRLSVSKCKTFAECKAKFNFTYNLKLPRKERDYHLFGKLCHKVLEDFHIAYLAGSQEPFNKEMLKAWNGALLEYNDKITADMKKDVWNLIDAYLKTVYEDKKGNKSANILACEKNFALNIGDNIVLNGMIDRVQLDADGILHVADYKSTKNKKYLKNDWFQLLTYAYVMYLENPDMDIFRVSYILLRHNMEYITKEFKVADLMDVKDKYITYAEEIRDATEYPANPNPLCNWCDHLEVCEPGRQYAEKRNGYQTPFGAVAW